MRTTVDLPDELFRQLKAEAGLRGRKLKELVTEFIERGLGSQNAPPSRSRSPLPVLRPPTGRPHPALSNAELENLLTVEDHHAGA